MRQKFELFELIQNHAHDPKWEIFAPDGYRFVDGPHSYLEMTKAAALAHQRDVIEPCPADCPCKE